MGNMPGGMGEGGGPPNDSSRGKDDGEKKKKKKRILSVIWSVLINGLIKMITLNMILY